MKAAVLTHYDKKGTDLEIQDIPVPVPEDDEILVRIMAAAVNPLDNMIIRGEVKLIVPYKVPLIMGNEFSGVVEMAGKKASRCELPAVKTAGFGGFSTSFELPSTVSYTQMAVMRRKSGA